MAPLGHLRGRRNEESAPASALLTNHLQAGKRLVWPFDHDVLEKVAQASLDRALIPRFDLQVVRDGAPLTDVPVGLG
jgi:hypothetical protein